MRNSTTPQQWRRGLDVLLKYIIGSLKVVSGKGCRSLPWYAIYGSMVTEGEVHTDNLGVMKVLWKGEENCKMQKRKEEVSMGNDMGKD